MKEKIFIHYGNDKYQPELITKEKNSIEIRSNKPAGSLWASPIDTLFGWKEFCECENFRLNTLDKSFKFKLKENARVLLINDEFINSGKANKLPIYLLGKYILFDFNKISLDYDVIEYVESYTTRFYQNMNYRGTDFISTELRFYGWDCDCIAVLNPDIVEEI